MREITDPTGAQSGIRTRLTCTLACIHRDAFLARLDRTKYYETVDILTGCSPVSIPVQPVRSDHHRLDSAYPVVAVQASRGKVRDNFEHVIGEPADVQNVLPIDHLCRRVRLKVD